MALNEDDGQLHTLTTLPLERIQVPIEQEAGWPQSWSGCREENKCILPLPGFKQQVIQPIAESIYRLYYLSSQIKHIQCTRTTLY